MPSKSIFLKIAINTGIGIFLILVWLRFVNFNEILVTLSRVDKFVLLPIILFMLVSPVIRAFRLKVFLKPIQKISFKDLIFLNGVAMMLNFLIPIRGGEIAKGVYLHSNYKLPFGKSLVWIFLDRFIDFLTVLILATGLFFLIPTSLSINFIIIITIITIIFIILVYLMVYKVVFAKKLLEFLSHLLIVRPIIIYFYRISNYFLDSFKILKRSPKDLLTLFALTVLAYAADGAIWFFTFLAIGSFQDFFKMYLAQILSALTYLVPAAPGYVGSAEASGLLIFSGVLGINPNLASAMIVLFHMVTIIFVIVFGVTSIYFLKIDLRLIFNKILKRT